VCDRFGLVEEMSSLLHSHSKHGHLKLYVQKLSPHQAPTVAAALLDAGCDGGRICEILGRPSPPLPSPSSPPPTEETSVVARVIEAFESRDQLPALEPWLQRQEGLEGAELEAVQEALQKLKPKGLWGLLG
ncbi:MAG: hypothetical protein SGPRY_012342, partial [Prymnesium sp.]